MTDITEKLRTSEMCMCVHNHMCDKLTRKQRKCFSFVKVIFKQLPKLPPTCLKRVSALLKGLKRRLHHNETTRIK